MILSAYSWASSCDGTACVLSAISERFFILQQYMTWSGRPVACASSAAKASARLDTADPSTPATIGISAEPSISDSVTEISPPSSLSSWPVERPALSGLSALAIDPSAAVSSAVSAWTIVTGTWARSRRESDMEPRNHLASLLSDLLPTIIWCEFLPMFRSAVDPAAWTEVRVSLSRSKSMPRLALSAHSLSSMVISLWIFSHSASFSGRSPISQEWVHPYTALTFCPVTADSRSAQFSAAKDSSDPSTPTTMSASFCVSDMRTPFRTASSHCACHSQCSSLQGWHATRGGYFTK